MTRHLSIDEYDEDALRQATEEYLSACNLRDEYDKALKLHEQAEPLGPGIFTSTGAFTEWATAYKAWYAHQRHLKGELHAAMNRINPRPIDEALPVNFNYFMVRLSDGYNYFVGKGRISSSGTWGVVVKRHGEPLINLETGRVVEHTIVHDPLEANHE